ncbi:MAG TPA: T9SS type A sorting domain-containing protein [Draconibacterium sp.]|nr:T9SS type A sorting domain-containing protein [Draconibacterium sp.]
MTFKILFTVVPLLIWAGKTNATNYYVNAATGYNSNTGRSVEKAFKTLQKAADKTIAGDTVFVTNGTYLKDYSYSSDVVVESSSGTPEKWIVWMNYPGHQPLISFDCWRAFNIQGSYIEVNGLTVKGNNSNITLEQALNQPKSCANPTGSYDGRFNGNGISVDGRNGTRYHHFKVKNCTVYDCGGAGITFIQSDYITIENNVIYNCSWYTLWSTSGISLWQNWNSDNETGVKNSIRNNICCGNRQYVPAIAFNCGFTDGNGIIIDDSENTQNGSTLGSYKGRTLIGNNICYKNGGSGIHTYESKHVDIINNTAYLNNQSNELNGGQIFANTSDDVRIFNNILVAPSNKKINSNYNNGKSNVYDYNLHFGGNSVALTGSHLIKGDPKFVDAANNDFHLLPESPAIDKGIDALSGSAAQVVDFDGNSRPMGTGFDIGAFEHEITSGTTRLNNDSDDFLVYPNPANRDVTVHFKAVPGQKILIQLFNLHGDFIWANSTSAASNGGNSFSVPLQHISEGVYFIKLINGNKTFSKMLVKK